MTPDQELADRVRNALADRPSLREVKMFGGLSFMVDDSMVVSVGSDGDLLVRADPERARELLAVAAARPAEMGAGRAMSGGWITVSQDCIADDSSLDFWLDVALEHNRTQR